jgi:hypothetical protein
MCRRVSLAIAVILFVSAGVFAHGSLIGSIDQYQEFAVGDIKAHGMVASVNLLRGDPYGYSYQELSVENKQDATASMPRHPRHCRHGWHHWHCGRPRPSSRSWAEQQQKAEITQEAEAMGSGVIRVNAFLDSYGTQYQSIGAGIGLKDQSQTLGLAADQVLFRTDGRGTGEAIHDVWLYEEQSGGNAAGTVKETSEINAYQRGFVSGDPSSTTRLTNSMTVDTMQWQTTH